ncbi:hypothetical protein GGX14DRAFT_657898 [Mycena pura]|uniref:IBR domain-containing protein n=1 Tax=Mycena pura TaxID=153505 RepID=A0AAD7E167_9AGAR|nr:hypothetical protein GGX14DRAFT_657898 [Mycena pura]
MPLKQTWRDFMKNAGIFTMPGAEHVARYQQYNDPGKRALEEWRARETNKGGKSAPDSRPKCTICQSHCEICDNPWQLTNEDRMAEKHAHAPDDVDTPRAGTRQRRKLHGIQLPHCGHIFCGVSFLSGQRLHWHWHGRASRYADDHHDGMQACLAQTIHMALNLTFNPDDYGTGLDQRGVETRVPGGRADFPVTCPECRGNPAEPPPRISSRTAQLVLGEANMENWRHVRYLSTLMECPHRGCGEDFDPKDPKYNANVRSSLTNAITRVQCPRCRGYSCKVCKCIWHDSLTCEAYRAMPDTDRSPEDIAFADLARQVRWRRCRKCSRMVELQTAVYISMDASEQLACPILASPHTCSVPSHITCVCRHHFCYKCGADFEYKEGKYQCTGGTGCAVWDEQNLFAQE